MGAPALPARSHAHRILSRCCRSGSLSACFAGRRRDRRRSRASRARPSCGGLRARRWAVIPPLSVAAFVLIAARGRTHQRAGPDLSRAVRRAAARSARARLARRRRAARHGAARAARCSRSPGPIAAASRGQAAALVLSALSCVTLGVLLALVTPPRWLAGGDRRDGASPTPRWSISDLLQRPNDALNAAHPAAGLPRLQSAELGSAVIGYGDLFVAGTLGALLAVACGRSVQLRGAALSAALALASTCFSSSSTSCRRRCRLRSR